MVIIILSPTQVSLRADVGEVESKLTNRDMMAEIVGDRGALGKLAKKIKTQED